MTKVVIRNAYGSYETYVSLRCALRLVTEGAFRLHFVAQILLCTVPALKRDSSTSQGAGLAEWSKSFDLSVNIHPSPWFESQWRPLLIFVFVVSPLATLTTAYKGLKPRKDQKPKPKFR